MEPVESNLNEIRKRQKLDPALVSFQDADEIVQRRVESFIPLRHSDLVARLANGLAESNEERAQYRKLCDQLTAIFHVEHLFSLLKVEDIYAPLDPDSEAVEVLDLSDEARAARVDSLFDEIKQILYTAHYHRLDPQELEDAINLGYRWGVKLDVDFSVFDRLEVFARGWKSVQHTRRRWQNFFRKETANIPEFHRLVMIFRLKDSKRIDKSLDTDVVYLKMFKDIPETDLEILLPGSQVKLSLFDQGKILVPNISSAAMTVYKVTRVGFVLTIFAAGLIWKWFIALAVMAGYCTKTMFSYFNTKDKYQFGLTKNLYVKNLDNNFGVIYRLFNEAEEQEMCETVLAYSILWQNDNDLGMTEDEFSEYSENFFANALKFDVKFDIYDALGKLARLELAHVDDTGRWKATPLDKACDRLKQKWDSIFINRDF